MFWTLIVSLIGIWLVFNLWIAISSVEGYELTDHNALVLFYCLTAEAEAFGLLGEFTCCEIWDKRAGDNCLSEISKNNPLYPLIDAIKEGTQREVALRLLRYGLMEQYLNIIHEKVIL